MPLTVIGYRFGKRQWFAENVRAETGTGNKTKATGLLCRCFALSRV